MALPFDLRLLAASADTFGDEPHDGSRNASGTPRRSSRAIDLPPDLVSRVQAHDVDAFRALVRRTYAPLVQFGRSILGTQDDAEDVVQDVFTIVWELGTAWSPKGDPVAYLFASVRNHALNEIRRRGRSKARNERASAENIPVAGGDEIDHSANALDALVEAEIDADRMHRVSTVLATCTELQRTAYELRYRRGLTIAGIAEVLGTTAKSAEHLTARVARLVLERLRAMEAGG